MADTNIRTTVETRDRLAAIAQAEGMSLRAYLEKLAAESLTPAERAEQAEKTRQIIIAMSGYDPAAPDTAADTLLAERIAAATGDAA